MARFKRKMRRLFRRKLRRTGRKLARRGFKSGKRMIKKARGITGQMKFKGYKSRINNRKEIKYTVYRNPGGIPIPSFRDTTLPTIIWSNNGRDPVGPINYYTVPQPGPNEDQMLGTKYNSKYVSLNFTMFQRQDVTPQAGRMVEMFRLMVFKERQSNQAFTGANLFKDLNVWNSPLRTKNWDVQYDKMWTTNTGASTPGLVNFNSGGTIMRPRNFRFIIPLKHTMETVPMNNAVDMNLFPFKIYVCIQQYFNLAADAGYPYWSVQQISAQYYYYDA